MALSSNWTDMIDGAAADARWDDYDKTIQAEVADYSSRLSLTAKDWRLFKAQLWTESGAASPAWKTRPMQIGNAGDPGLQTLQQHKEHSDLIMSDDLMKLLDAGHSVNDPVFNVRLGLAYAYTELSSFTSVVLDPQMLEYVVKSGDAIETIARRQGTTKQNLFQWNPGAKAAIFPKQKLKYQKAAIQPTGFAVSSQLLQDRYNRGGDNTYAEKIDYAYAVILKLKR